MTPMPRVRRSKISLPMSRVSISSQKPGTFFMHAPGLVDPALGQVVLEAADAVEVGVEAPAGGRLDQVEHVLAVAEGEEDRGQGAELDAHVAEEQDEVGDAAQLEEDACGSTGPGAAPRRPSASRRPG